jgi:hypothetical protein
MGASGMALNGNIRQKLAAYDRMVGKRLLFRRSKVYETIFRYG